MLRRRPALGILCFVSFLALKTQAAHRSCSKDIVKRVQTLIDKAPDVMLLDVRLYTPTTEDFENCSRSNLKCFADEIKVLCGEWETVGVQIENFKLDVKLEKLALKNPFFNQTLAACRQCELFKKQNATMFLSDLKSTLQMMNQRFCE